MKIVSVDFQGDFTSENGSDYKPRPCVDFIKAQLVPYLAERRLSIAEIVSDYRLPRPGDEYECCVPGTPGFTSDIPETSKMPEPWVKCMNSPDWIRENGGNPQAEPGLPYPDPNKFSLWLKQLLGTPDKTDEVVLIGLTLDCCVLCTAQALAHRAYRVRYLLEAVDTYSGDQNEKSMLLQSAALNWGKPMTWHEFRGITITES